MFYEDVFGAFDQKQVRYLVVGALAMNLYGAPRMTADLDIVADLEERNFSLVVNTLTELGYRPRLPVAAQEVLSSEKREQWRKEKGLVAFTFIHPKIRYQEVDILLQMPISYEEAEEEKTVVRVESLKIPVMSIDHLIALKQRAGREQDRSDIDVLKRIKVLKSGGTSNS